MNWKTPEEQFKNDKYKEECANEKYIAKNKTRKIPKKIYL